MKYDRIQFELAVNTEVKRLLKVRLTSRERDFIAAMMSHATILHNATRGEVDIDVWNTNHTGGFNVRISPEGKVTHAGRFVNQAWVKQQLKNATAKRKTSKSTN